MTAQTSQRTAEITPIYGMRPIGGFGLRGWRVFCPTCGYLSKDYTNYRGVEDATRRHRCTKGVKK
jgi:hypothetical protein